jgi:hypothetical protein
MNPVMLPIVVDQYPVPTCTLAAKFCEVSPTQRGRSGVVNEPCGIGAIYKLWVETTGGQPCETTFQERSIVNPASEGCGIYSLPGFVGELNPPEPVVDQKP